jgi:hypothetical protein
MIDELEPDGQTQLPPGQAVSGTAKITGQLRS